MPSIFSTASEQYLTICAENALSVGLPGVDQLAADRFPLGHDDVVAVEDGDRIARGERLRLEHGVAEAEDLFLADERDIAERSDALYFFERLKLAALLEAVFQLGRAVEMVDDQVFPAACDDQDVFDPGGNGFLNDILDRRLIDDRQQLLGHRFCSREHSGSEPGCGDNRFFYLLHHSFLLIGFYKKNCGA